MGRVGLSLPVLPPFLRVTQLEGQEATSNLETLPSLTTASTHTYGRDKSSPHTQDTRVLVPHTSAIFTSHS